MLCQEECVERDAGQMGRLRDNMGAIGEDDGVFARGVRRGQAGIDCRVWCSGEDVIRGAAQVGVATRAW